MVLTNPGKSEGCEIDIPFVFGFVKKLGTYFLQHSLLNLRTVPNKPGRFGHPNLICIMDGKPQVHVQEVEGCEINTF